MRRLGFRILFVVVGTALAFLATTSISVGSSGSRPDSFLTACGDSVMVVEADRKLKEESHDMSTVNGKRDLGSIDMEDYPHFDPVPSSKAAVKPGPIEHGTPLMPYVPRLMPPSHPRHGGSP